MMATDSGSGSPPPAPSAPDARRPARPQFTERQPADEAIEDARQQVQGIQLGNDVVQIPSIMVQEDITMTDAASAPPSCDRCCATNSRKWCFITWRGSYLFYQAYGECWCWRSLCCKRDLLLWSISVFLVCQQL